MNVSLPICNCGPLIQGPDWKWKKYVVLENWELVWWPPITITVVVLILMRQWYTIGSGRSGPLTVVMPGLASSVVLTNSCCA